MVELLGGGLEKAGLLMESVVWEAQGLRRKGAGGYLALPCGRGMGMGRTDGEQ